MITQVYEFVRQPLVGRGANFINGDLYSDDEKATAAMHTWVRANVENVNRYWDPQKVAWICSPTDRPYAVFVRTREVL